ncbi:MAG: hypothetical protein QY326_08065 [Bdellovibrionota bacterium]|nr:MAG: hypothetical protein QY326_08065 [Bdellovibrionota bacterium]
MTTPSHDRAARGGGASTPQPAGADAHSPIDLQVSADVAAGLGLAKIAEKRVLTPDEAERLRRILTNFGTASEALAKVAKTRGSGGDSRGQSEPA